jgi:hypothetical protein
VVPVSGGIDVLHAENRRFPVHGRPIGTSVLVTCVRRREVKEVMETRASVIGVTHAIVDCPSLER